MRHIYWGLVLTISGIYSFVILSLVTFYELLVENYPFMNAMRYYIALFYITRFAMFFSLPLATAIEALRSLNRIMRVKA